VNICSSASLAKVEDWRLDFWQNSASDTNTYAGASTERV
jgi:hypothetical protein